MRALEQAQGKPSLRVGSFLGGLFGGGRPAEPGASSVPASARAPPRRRPPMTRISVGHGSQSFRRSSRRLPAGRRRFPSLGHGDGCRRCRRHAGRGRPSVTSMGGHANANDQHQRPQGARKQARKQDREQDARQDASDTDQAQQGPGPGRPAGRLRRRVVLGRQRRRSRYLAGVSPPLVGGVRGGSLVNVSWAWHPRCSRHPPRKGEGKISSRRFGKLSLASDLQREGVVERHFLELLEAARSAAVAGLHVGLQQDQAVAGVVVRAAARSTWRAPSR